MSEINLSEYKNTLGIKHKILRVLLDLIEVLNKKGQNFNLFFVGDGHEKKNLEETTSNKNLNDQIKFYGPSYDKFEIYSLIASSDCCISLLEK